MKFRISRDHFTNGLGQVLNVVGAKASAPILNNVLIEATQTDRVVLTTSNLDMCIRCTVKATVTETGTTTLPVRKLAAIVKELPETDLSLETTANHHCAIKSGRSSFRVVGLPKEEFPPVVDFSDERSVTLDQSMLAEMLRCVGYAQSQDETRFILNGVFFHLQDKKVTLVATDGRRLASISREPEGGLERAGSFILPARTVAELARMLDKGAKMRIAFNERRVSFEIDSDSDVAGFVDRLHLISRVVEGNYPNYQQVIPKETVHRVKIERQLLAECVHRVSLVTTERAQTLRLKFGKDQLEIAAQSPEYGEAHETVAIEYAGPETQLGFNPAYLLDPLKALSKDDVFFEFKDEMSPGVFKTLDAFICVVMPVRIV